ncbi:Transposase and inactivated derivatives, IS1 family [Mucilaginibacter mallensis]|uniref:Transposase and inactivated derivatives, IS1 family n=1 Tax=Mucilaginibacter mallensis TaxID=652787 RepID=A0A1H1MRT3_MUCMA|nr:IS1 family transposase [Mucilaginibacter mallensis]SDR89416.1 Transposase and inactivated derivatives, IS1 family [Mucilaginibacter mallensis]
MNRCNKSVVNPLCNGCNGLTIKHGLVHCRQRYRCKNCKRTQMGLYKNNACSLFINNKIVNYIKEGCGIRSIARLLQISTSTVLRRIKDIANCIKKPLMRSGRIFEVDELRTYIGNKNKECWVIYALDKETGQVADLKVGRRTKTNVKRVIDTLLIAKCKQIYTDGLGLYQQILPTTIHKVKRYGTNKIERKNLSLRTHLKRLNRRSICYSKKAVMLEACLKIYFWYDGCQFALP